jgi:nitrate reductase beta subunit
MFLDMFLLLLALLKVDLISYYSLIYYYDYSSSSIKIYIFCFPRVVLGRIGLDYNDAVGLIEAIIAVVVFNDDANTFRSFLHEFILIFIIF